MTGEQLPKIFYEELTHGKRLLGGQLKRYKDTVHSIVKEAGIENRLMDISLKSNPNIISKERREKFRGVEEPTESEFRGHQDEF